jgi:uncharacterized DUF497 family protein
MSSITFTWDEKKAKANLEKHSIGFDEAKTVFADEFARLIPDPDHSETEDRFILLGLSKNVRLIMVCHCYRGEDEVVRILSARKADRTESKHYRGFRHA